ncbi:hypothetical protein WJX81_008358 [Elliptochloris bilobata]|uniref:Uncharacterized protein n=1 Tax=Elliptochloris bilobata TaxID=381761 RepID=A0AAW1S489_9CHLO
MSVPSGPSWLQLGCPVEVVGRAEDGFPASFSEAEVCSTSAAEESQVPKVQVKYNDFVDEHGEKLTELFSLRNPRLRPASKKAHSTLAEYERGEAVDVKDNDVWWQGVVTSVTPELVRVYFPDVDGGTKQVTAAENIRLGQEWRQGKWHARIPPPLEPAQPQAAATPGLDSLEGTPPPETAEMAGAPGSAPAPASNGAVSAPHANGGSSMPGAFGGAPGASGPVPLPLPVLTLQQQHQVLMLQMHLRNMQQQQQQQQQQAAALPASAYRGSLTNAASQGGGLGGSAFMPRPHKKRKGGDDSSDEDEWKPSSHSVLKAANMLALSAKSDAAAAEDAAQAEAAADAGGVNVRRSTRAVKNRVIMIDGEPVLKANNYDLESGEQSIFDVELNREPKDGKEEEPAKGSGWVTMEAQPRVTAAPVQPRAAPKHYNAIEQARLEHNARVRMASIASEGRRARFLLNHIEVLLPFITPQAAAHIRYRAANYNAAADPIHAPVEAQPACLQGEMREYQVEGLRWMVSRLGDSGVNAILADEMGLGKTLQTISFLSYMQTERGVGGPSLVVVPLSVLPSWMAEFKRWAPNMRVVRFHCNDVQERLRLRREVLANPSSFDVALTTYEMVQSQQLGMSLCRTIYWRYLVLDEGHKIKNEHTNVAHTMRQVSRQNVLLLTGTPLQNNLHELYALLNFLYPDVFTDPHPFDNAFDLVHLKVDRAQLEKAGLLLRPFCLRRLKEDVEKSLPPRVETRINCPLSAMQTFWYRRLLLKDSKMLKSLEAEFSSDPNVQYERDNDSWRKMQHLVMQLRKCCNHPYLFPGAEPDFDGHSTGEDIVEASGKMGVLDRMLRKLKERGHRVTLFSQYNRMLDVIEDYLIYRGYKYVRLDGSTNRVQRMIDINRFNRPGSDLFIYILNTRAGGLGVNLQSADTCILYDSDWNPALDCQAMARVHRIGQTRTCHVYRFCTVGTVEERVQQRAEKKLFLEQMVNRGTHISADDLEGLSKGEMLSMLRFGADRIFQNAEGRPPSDEDLDAIIDRSDKLGEAAGGLGAGSVLKADAVSLDGAVADPAAAAAAAAEAAAKALREGLVDQKQSAADFNAEEVLLSTCILQGTDYSEARSVKDIAAEFWAGGGRERKQRLITVDGFQVLRENNYSLNEGEPSVYGRETARPVDGGYKKKGRQVAGKDYTHSDLCQICWDGGLLVCCDECPASYHFDCLGMTEEDVPKRWACPHHKCVECGRSTAAAGGLLFRCQGCANAYCEDHLPHDADILQICPRFQYLGQLHPRPACFVHCCADCRAFTESMPHLFDEATLIEKQRAAEAARRAEEEAAKEAADAAAAEAAAAEAEAEEAGRKTRRKRSAAAAALTPANILTSSTRRRKSSAAAAAALAAEAALEAALDEEDGDGGSALGGSSSSKRSGKRNKSVEEDDFDDDEELS